MKNHCIPYVDIILRVPSAFHRIVLGSSIGVRIRTLRVWFVSVTYGSGYLGVAPNLQSVRMSRFALELPCINRQQGQQRS